VTSFDFYVIQSQNAFESNMKLANQKWINRSLNLRDIGIAAVAQTDYTDSTGGLYSLGRRLKVTAVGLVLGNRCRNGPQPTFSSFQLDAFGCSTLHTLFCYVPSQERPFLALDFTLTWDDFFLLRKSPLQIK